MKKIISLLLLFVLFYSPSTIFAHILVTDNLIGAVIHIDPDDDPIAKKESTFFFDFKDKSDKLDLSECNCEFQVFENGNKIYSQPLTPLEENGSATATYTFPKKGVYMVKVVGTSVNSSFDPFTLSYDVRVSRSVSNNASSIFSYVSNETLLILLIVSGVIMLLGFIKIRNSKG